MQFATIFLVVWFVSVLSLSLTGWFQQFSSVTLFEVGTAAPVLGFGLLQSFSARFREFVRKRSLKRLTLGQVLRFYGILASIEVYRHVLPPAFGIPTTIIDLTFAISSFYVATHLVDAAGRPKPGFIAWHVAGLTGLATLIALAILTSSNQFGLAPNGVTSQAMTRFPFSLVPVFIGSLVILLHIIAIADAISAGSRVQQSGYASL